MNHAIKRTARETVIFEPSVCFLMPVRYILSDINVIQARDKRASTLASRGLIGVNKLARI